jgi:hypothetical protein
MRFGTTKRRSTLDLGSCRGTQWTYRFLRVKPCRALGGRREGTGGTGCAINDYRGSNLAGWCIVNVDIDDKAGSQGARSMWPWRSRWRLAVRAAGQHVRRSAAGRLCRAGHAPSPPWRSSGRGMQWPTQRRRQLWHSLREVGASLHLEPWAWPTRRDIPAGTTGRAQACCAPDRPACGCRRGAPTSCLRVWRMGPERCYTQRGDDVTTCLIGTGRGAILLTGKV